MLPMELEETPIPSGLPHMTWDQKVTAAPLLHYLTFGACTPATRDLLEYDEQGNAYLEMWCPGETSKLFDGPAPKAGQDKVLRSYLAGNCRTTVVERDDDLLTKDDLRKYPKEVASATLEELQTWIDHDCFRRRPRRGARNILDVRWVAKWKFRKAKDDAE